MLELLNDFPQWAAHSQAVLKPRMLGLAVCFPPVKELGYLLV